MRVGDKDTCTGVTVRIVFWINREYKLGQYYSYVYVCSSVDKFTLLNLYRPLTDINMSRSIYSSHFVESRADTTDIPYIKL